LAFHDREFRNWKAGGGARVASHSKRRANKTRRKEEELYKISKSMLLTVASDNSCGDFDMPVG